MSKEINYIYDVFISYSSADREWVQSVLLLQLEQAGLRVIIDHRDFALGLSRMINTEQAVQQSRKILLVLTRDSLSHKRAHFEALLAQTVDLDGGQSRVLPL